MDGFKFKLQKRRRRRTKAEIEAGRGKIFILCSFVMFIVFIWFHVFLLPECHYLVISFLNFNTLLLLIYLVNWVNISIRTFSVTISRYSRELSKGTVWHKICLEYCRWWKADWRWLWYSAGLWNALRIFQNAMLGESEKAKAKSKSSFSITLEKNWSMWLGLGMPNGWIVSYCLCLIQVFIYW